MKGARQRWRSGYAVEAAAGGVDVGAVVEDSGFASLAGVVGSTFTRHTLLPADPFAAPMLALSAADLGVDLGRIRPVDAAARLRKPLLAIVGTAGRLVPPAHGRSLFRAARGLKGPLVVPGAGHTGAHGRAPELYRRTVLDFLAAHMGA